MRLSYSKVRAITRVATPENEELLVEIAVDSTAADLERICRRFRSVLDREQDALTPAEADARRTVIQQHRPDGSMRFIIDLPADEGARLLAAIQAGQFARDPVSADAHVSAETPPPRRKPAPRPGRTA